VILSIGNFHIDNYRMCDTLNTGVKNMARKTGTHTFFASPPTQRTRISIEVPIGFRAAFVADAYQLGMTQFEYLAHLREYFVNSHLATVISSEAADLAAEEHDANTARAGAQ
jgi:hypothetical protein